MPTLGQRLQANIDNETASLTAAVPNSTAAK